MLERAFRDPSKHIQIISNSNKSRTGAAYLPVRIQHFVWDPPHIDFVSTCCQYQVSAKLARQTEASHFGCDGHVLSECAGVALARKDAKRVMNWNKCK